MATWRINKIWLCREDGAQSLTLSRACDACLWLEEKARENQAPLKQTMAQKRTGSDDDFKDCHDDVTKSKCRSIGVG